jgi:hypothetical protein
MRKQFKSSSDGGDSGSLWRDLMESAFGGSMESGGLFDIGAFGRNLTSFAVKLFSHLNF